MRLSSSSSDGTLTTLDQPQPSWLTPELEAKIVASGAKGLEVPLAPQQALEVNCLGLLYCTHAALPGISVTW